MIVGVVILKSLRVKKDAPVGVCVIVIPGSSVEDDRVATHGTVHIYSELSVDVCRDTVDDEF